jgi:hypothetical protein
MRCGRCKRLSAQYRTGSVDWPGFGDLPRPPLDWTPDAYRAFLAFVLDTVTPTPHAIIAAGHAASYALVHACDRPKVAGRLSGGADMARSAADNDERPSAVLSSAVQHGRSAGAGAVAVQAERRSPYGTDCGDAGLPRERIVESPHGRPPIVECLDESPRVSRFRSETALALLRLTRFLRRTGIHFAGKRYSLVLGLSSPSLLSARWCLGGPLRSTIFADPVT